MKGVDELNIELYEEDETRSNVIDMQKKEITMLTELQMTLEEKN